MRTKSSKLCRLIGVLLCFVLLFNMLPLQAVFAESGVSALAEDLVKYRKVTETAELLKDSQFVITYLDTASGTRYALSAEGPDYTTEVAQRSNEIIMVDKNGSYVFTQTKNNGSGTFKFENEASGLGLKINNNDGLFASSAADLYLEYKEDRWSIRSSSRALTFADGKFAVLNGTEQAMFEIWTAAPASTDYVKLASLEQLADLKSDTDFVIAVETAEGLKAMGAKSNSKWLYDIETYEDTEGTNYISVDDSYKVVLNIDALATPTSGTFNKVKYWGFDENGIKLKDSSDYYYPQYINDGSHNSPFRSGTHYDKKQSDGTTVKEKINYTVQFEYGTGADSEKIYIRGNRDGESAYKQAVEEAEKKAEEDPDYVVNVDRDNYGSYLGYKDNKYIGTAMQDSEYRIPVQIYIAVSKDVVRVEYLDTNDNVSKIAFANADSSISLLRTAEDVTYNGYNYSFVGWTMEKPATPFLSLDDSCNIFDYDNDKGYAHILDSIAQKYKLIGECNPDRPSAKITFADENIVAGQTLQLYPVYAVHGFDSVVTANDGDTRIVGVSDWKADQGVDTYYFDDVREKWLGYIDVQIYKDGIEWVEPTRLYFRYHNDNSADLSIKFIWDELIDGNTKYIDTIGDLDPLYLYMSDREQFPLYDQSGHYVVDAVHAHQGGSEEGLFYKLNWMTDHGGQLDNVVGGELVRLFISTKYTVKYYLNDVELTDKAYVNENLYTTPGTEEVFKSIDTATNHKVRPDNEYAGLMDRDFVADNDPDKTPEQREQYIEKDPNKRGLPQTFSYVMHNYDHIIPFAGSPEKFVTGGESLISKSWILKDKNDTIKGYYDWGYEYDIIGYQYGSGNTVEAYKENTKVTAYEADSPYIYHLYAYSGVTGNITIDNTVTGNDGETDRDFNIIITVDDETVNGTYGDLVFEKGVARTTLKHGESKSATGLPAGVTYTVEEVEANKEGYTTTSKSEKGTIKANGTVDVHLVNDRNKETSPQTGDSGNISLWLTLMLTSLLGAVILLILGRKSRKA